MTGPTDADTNTDTDTDGAVEEPSEAGGHRPAPGEPLLERAFRLLACFGPHTPVLSLTGLAARAQLPKATAWRIARQLVDHGALERTAAGHYTIGLRLLELATLAPRGHGLRAAALPHLHDLCHATRQHVQLVVSEGSEAVLVERLSARDAKHIRYRVGGRLPLNATAPGLVLLACAPRTYRKTSSPPTRRRGRTRSAPLVRRYGPSWRPSAVTATRCSPVPHAKTRSPGWPPPSSTATTTPSPPSPSSARPSGAGRHTYPQW
ncbi:helix-turn-helix domain-containing protein [Streptomyces olivochromogenes]|nr:helix-turn-helix domain-containing protein [Streptomyces olivochromogenes]MCF3131527.1 helix-turn-helix domain-containing protein [Streptomyces olivochromogenes]